MTVKTRNSKHVSTLDLEQNIYTRFRIKHVSTVYTRFRTKHVHTLDLGQNMHYTRFRTKHVSTLDLGQNMFYKETELQCKIKYEVYITSILLSSFDIYF